MPNTAPSPWRMFLPLGIVLLLALLWSAYWFVASAVARDRLAAERTRLAEQGLTLACTNEGWGGYPFHFEFSCSSPVVTLGGQAEMKSAELLLVALAYAPWQVAALLDGPTTITAPGLVPTQVSHQRALASVTLDGKGQPSFAAELPAVVVPGAGSAGKLTLFTRPAASAGTDVAIQGSELSFQPSGTPALAVDEASLLGTLTPDQTFNLEKAEARQGQLRYWGSGKLSLDAQHRLQGQIDTETNDSKALLALVGPLLGLSDNKLSNLRTMLGLLGNGAKAPIIAKDGLLYLGPFEIGELKPLY